MTPVKIFFLQNDCTLLMLVFAIGTTCIDSAWGLFYVADSHDINLAKIHLKLNCTIQYILNDHLNRELHPDVTRSLHHTVCCYKYTPRGYEINNNRTVTNIDKRLWCHTLTWYIFIATCMQHTCMRRKLRNYM